MTAGKIGIGLIALLALSVGGSAALAQTPVGSIPEKVEWTWEVRPAHVNPELPNVLLLGDSITRNYYPTVERQLADKANVYLMATSASIGDPRLPAQIADFSTMEAVHFSIIHFNNGMHGWDYSEAQYKGAFPSFIKAIHAIAPTAKLIWATTTPVKVDAVPGATNARVEARNAIAKVAVEASGIPIDDQHELMMHHRDSYEDTVHFNTAGAKIQGNQVVASIQSVLHK